LAQNRYTANRSEAPTFIRVDALSSATLEHFPAPLSGLAVALQKEDTQNLAVHA
jgi:hypothetical protein